MMRKIGLKLIIVLFIISVVFPASISFAAVGINKQISYQGTLKTSVGANVADSSYDIVFKIYDASVSGTLLWTGTHTSANSNAVSVSSGIFSVLLGSGTGNSLDLDFNSDSYFLGITVESDSEMTPRQRIGAAGYAFNADTVDGSHASDFLSLTDWYATTTTDIAEGSNLYWTDNRFAGALEGTTTDAVSEGSSNLYWTDNRFDARLSSTTTLPNLTTLLGLTNSSTTQLTVTGDAWFTGGNVGIGTTTPATFLHVEGDGDKGIAIGDGTLAVNSSFFHIEHSSNDDSGVDMWLLNRSTSVESQASIWMESNNRAVGYGMVVDGLGTYSDGGGTPAVVFDMYTNHPMIFNTNATERMRITNSGNVGIGTTSPYAKLSITNTGAMPSFIVEDADSPDLSQFIIDANGNVGIGTTSPSANFVINGTTGQNLFQIATSTDQNIIIVNQDGNVGIGTAGPESRFQVSGGGLCVGSDANCNTDNNTEGVVYSSATAMTAYDVAEMYPTYDTTIEPAEVVALDLENGIFVKRAEESDVRLLGVISMEPAVILGGFVGAQFTDEHQVAVALSGRVPVKVITENGPISIGDFLTISSQEGVARKAEPNEQTIGYALEQYSDDGVGIIQFFVNLDKAQMQEQNLSLLGSEQIGDELQGNIDGNLALENIIVSDAVFEGDIIVRGHTTFGSDSVGIARIKSGDSNVDIIFEQQYENEPIITATPIGIHSIYYGIENISIDGFTITIEPIQNYDIDFNWHAFSSSNPAKIHTSVSDNINQQSQQTSNVYTPDHINLELQQTLDVYESESSISTSTEEKGVEVTAEDIDIDIESPDNDENTASSSPDVSSDIEDLISESDEQNIVITDIVVNQEEAEDIIDELEEEGNLIEDININEDESDDIQTIEQAVEQPVEQVVEEQTEQTEQTTQPQETEETEEEPLIN